MRVRNLELREEGFIELNILCGIVLYNPEIDLLKRNIDAICAQEYDKPPVIYIVDNGSSNRSKVENLLNDYGCITYEYNVSNRGIAAALNQIMEYAMKNNFDWVLSLDQDSVIPGNMMGKYIDFLCSGNAEAVGMVSPSISDRNLKKTEGNTSSQPIEINKCITSGSLLKTAVWDEIGRYNEWMFIDFVDLDICARVRIAGYKIYRLDDVVMSHSIGVSVEHKLFGHRIVSTNHSPIRHYYFSRNLIYFARKYGKYYPDLNFWKMWLLEFISAVLFEENKIEKVASMVRGMIDSERG